MTTFTRVKKHAAKFSADEYAQARHDGRERTANGFPIAQQEKQTPKALGQAKATNKRVVQDAIQATSVEALCPSDGQYTPSMFF